MCYNENEHNAREGSIMRILENMTAAELNYYTSRPTSRELLEKTRRDGKYIPPGDKSAAIYTREHGKNPSLSPAVPQDKAEISAAGQAKARPTPQISFSLTRIGDTDKFSLTFDNSAMLNRAVKQGFLEIEGKRIELSDDVKKQLLATDKQLQESRRRVAAQNFLLHEAAASRQNSDAMKAANDKMARTLKTASRIMQGKKVSPADEKELMEFNHELYYMAKNAAVLNRYRRKKEDDDEYEEISQANDAARQREAEPKDYSVKEIEPPNQKAQMTVSLDGEAAEVLSVGIESQENK